MNALTLKQKRINSAFSQYENSHQWYNCWGATLYVLGAVNRLFWEDDTSMDSWLRETTATIHRPRKAGDIVEVRSDYSDRLLHTAVYLGNGLYFHKRGGNSPEVTDLVGVRKIYQGKYAWRRVLEKAL